ncbi:hypothetical protein ABZ611_26105 [Streptomyces sp. NPDC007861]|uniref:hypothetical protein n=1 Tax=Streptomyces sp. NPDC007861 TaxID=3154893 RepID=UPI003410633B
MTRQENAVFVDASGRRRRLMRYASVGIGAACVCFVAVVLAGFFGAGPAGGPLPWSQSRQEPAPAADEPGPSTAAPGESGGGEQGAGPGPDEGAASPSATGRPESSAPAATGTAAPTGPAATTEAVDGATATATALPGNSGNAPRRSPAADGAGGAEGKGPK